MEKTGREDVVQHNARLLTTLLEISNLVSSAMDLKPLLEAILDKLKCIIDYKNAKIFTVTGNYIRLIAHRSQLTEEEAESYSMPLDVIPAGLGRFFPKEPMVIPDITSEDELATAFRNTIGEYMDTLYSGSHCWMSLPMISKDKVIGVLTLDHVKAGYYKRRHVELGTAFANQAAIEYENAKLYNETTKKADEIKTMFNIQRAITSRLELDAVLRLIAGEARRLSNAHSTAVFLIEGTDLILSVSSGMNHPGASCNRLRELP